MSTGTGLTFLGWVRTGLLQAIQATAGTQGSPLDAGLPGQATLPITLALADGGSGRFEASLAGPGDVVGIDPRQVIRCFPQAGASGVAPNTFACIEFDRPDVPWMLTPGAPAEARPGDADARRGLRPWICLAVVTDRQIEPPTTVRPLPRLTVLDTELPDLETAWLWAHAQVLTEAGEDLLALLTSCPERTLSRLIAPRRLEPATTYLACVVPTFEAGRRAGLGLESQEGPLAPAWRRGEAPRTVELPVYHSWRFSTARQHGDFEALVRRIHAIQSGEAGVTRLNVGDGGAELPGPATGAAAWEIPLEGVIIGSRIVPGAWTGPEKPSLQAALAAKLAAGGDELAPPTYGARHAGYDGSLADSAAPRWLRDLNLDPRYRVMASLGTQLVQQHQEALVASAWEQTAAMREANRILRQAQLARAVGEVLDARLRAPGALSTSRLLQLTAPVHSQVLAGTRNATVASALNRSAAVRSAISVPFRRVARPRGPLARRLTAEPLKAPLARLALPATSADALRPTPTLGPVGGTFALDGAAAAGANESFATLTRARVEKAFFPWEPAPQAAPPNVPFAYLSDLVITTRSMPGPGVPAGSPAAYVGRALDFDGMPQLGWEQTDSGSNNWTRHGEDFPGAYAQTGGAQGVPGGYVERGGVQGVFRADGRTYTYGYKPCLFFRPGFLLEGTGADITGDDVDRRPAAVAFADVHGNGAIDLVFFHLDKRSVPAGASPGSVWFDHVYDTFLTVGLDFDPATGHVRGGWTQHHYLVRDQREPPRIPKLSAAGARLFALEGGTLQVLDLSVLTYGSYQPRLTAISRRIEYPLPDEFLAGDIAAADFGGLTGIDLLVAHVEGRDGNLRLSYRVAYDIDANGKIGRLGPAHSPPIPVAGANIQVSLGLTTAASAELRAEKTAAFRAAAGRTQARQERIVAAAEPPSPTPYVDTDNLAIQVQAAIEPGKAVEAATAARLVLAAPMDPSRVSDPLQPLALTPKFPYPTGELLRDAFQERLFPGASGLPDNVATVLAVNRASLEAFLVGMNHELSRELLWRQFPVHHGTYFSCFWNAGDNDITKIEDWPTASALGSHAPSDSTEPSLLLVVRAELLRRIPDVMVRAVPAKKGQNGQRTPDLTRPLEPLFGGRLLPDIAFFAFGPDFSPAVAAGADGTDGWYFIFQEHPTAPRFGIDEANDGYGSLPATWADLAWPQLAPSAEALQSIVNIDAGADSPLAGLALPDGSSSTLVHRWGFSAAHMAHITLQRPVLIAVHGSDLIPKAEQ